MSLFIDQSLWTIQLDTFRGDLDEADVTQILYWKPDYSKGYFSASISGTVLYYEFQGGEIDQIGVWKFQTYIEKDGLKGYGTIYQHRFEQHL